MRIRNRPVRCKPPARRRTRSCQTPAACSCPGGSCLRCSPSCSSCSARAKATTPRPPSCPSSGGSTLARCSTCQRWSGSRRCSRWSPGAPTTSAGATRTGGSGPIRRSRRRRPAIASSPPPPARSRRRICGWSRTSDPSHALAHQALASRPILIGVQSCMTRRARVAQPRATTARSGRWRRPPYAAPTRGRVCVNMPKFLDFLHNTLRCLYRGEAAVALTGDLSETPFTDLVQFYCQRRETVALVVRSSRGEGTFFIQNGDVVDAHLGTHRGLDAIRTAMKLRDGTFRVDKNAVCPARAIHEPWTKVLLEEAWREDEANRDVEDALAGL